MAKKKTEKTTPLKFIGPVSARYMLENGSIARVKPGEEVETPAVFVKQRLSEPHWVEAEEVPNEKPVEEKGGKE